MSVAALIGGPESSRPLHSGEPEHADHENRRCYRRRQSQVPDSSDVPPQIFGEQLAGEKCPEDYCPVCEYPPSKAADSELVGESKDEREQECKEEPGRQA